MYKNDCFNSLNKEHKCEQLSMCLTSEYQHTDLSGYSTSLTKAVYDSSCVLNDSVKLDDSASTTLDLFPTHALTWQQHPMNNQEHAHLRLDLTSKQLLQGSDDPLICHGAADAPDEDHPLEFKSIIEQKNTELQQHNQRKVSFQSKPSVLLKSKLAGCSSLTKQQLKVKANLMSVQNKQQNVTPIPIAIKHKSTSISEQNGDIRTTKPKNKRSVKLRFHHQALPPIYLSHYESTNSQNNEHKKISEENKVKNMVKNSTTSTKRPSPAKNSNENVRSWLQKIAEIQRAAEQHKQMQQNQKKDEHKDFNNNCELNTVNEHVDQLPVDNADSRPFIVSDRTSCSPMKYSDLPYMGEITLYNSKPRRGRKPKKADICHLIYKNYGTIVPTGTQINAANVVNGFGKSTVSNLEIKKCDVLINEEPLNLCLRDQTEKSVDCYSATSSAKEIIDSKIGSVPKTIVHEGSLGTSNFYKEIPDLKRHLSSSQLNVDNTTTLIDHSVRLYYQKLLESSCLSEENGQTVKIPFETIEKDNQLALKIPIPNCLIPSLTKFEKPMYNTSTNSVQLRSTKTNITSKSKLNRNMGKLHLQSIPPKRKRSAIFIPPMPAENSSNPPTEVSICKFKFTGGAKPTLQEKKMLSVDSDGNYRFSNGIGCEKILQNSENFNHDKNHSVLSITSHNYGVSDKIYVDIPPPSADLSNELLHIPLESPTSALLQPVVTISSSIRTQSPPASGRPLSQRPKTNQVHKNCIELGNTTDCEKHEKLERKRKLMRFTQKDKYETFRDKGFLIQTQQLESEGATYCKFRQLKKFTRYLFRNWKDYLPNDDNDTSKEHNHDYDDTQSIKNILSKQDENSNLT